MNEYKIVMREIGGYPLESITVWADDKKEARQKAKCHFRAWGIETMTFPISCEHVSCGV